MGTTTPNRETIKPNGFLGIGSRLRHRGVATTKGAFGYCRSCRRDCPEGPDICLGHIEGADGGACCGHGILEPWVVLNGVLYRGEEARRIFEASRA